MGGRRKEVPFTHPGGIKLICAQVGLLRTINSQWLITPKDPSVSPPYEILRNFLIQLFPPALSPWQPLICLTSLVLSLLECHIIWNQIVCNFSRLAT